MKIKLQMVLSALVSGLCLGAQALPVTIIHSFDGTNGFSPTAPLLQGTDGDFYGTAFDTVFRLRTNGTMIWTSKLNPTNGYASYGGLAQGADGSLYGTAAGGGYPDLGGAFKLTTNGNFVWWAGLSPDLSQGGFPGAGLTRGQDGLYYGVASQGGANNFDSGTIFRVTTNGALSLFFTFHGTNGFNPFSRGSLLLLGQDGCFYGTTYQGGTNFYPFIPQQNTAGEGTVFKLATNGTLVWSHSLNYGDMAGVRPAGGLVQSTDGGLYGTCSDGGTNGFGTVFKMTTNGTVAWTFSFNGTNGWSPSGSLVFGPDGNLYGTTERGGSGYDGFNVGNGSVFMISTNGVMKTLTFFDGTSARTPEASLTVGVDGDIYGTTRFGGTYDGGTVFRVTIPRSPVIIGLTRPPGAFPFCLILFRSQMGLVYELQYRTNLSTGAWLPAGVTYASGDLTLMTDFTAVSPERYYRIKVVP